MRPEQHITGAELARQLREAAAASGEPDKAFLRPLFGSAVAAGLLDLHRAARPTPFTIARVRAFLAGDPVPPRRSYKRSGVVAEHRDAAARGMVRDQRTPASRVPPVLTRDPCTFCGVRADIGCRHRPASQPEAFA